MCFGGGDDKAAKAAERAENERQARITGNVSQINSAFAGRESQYRKFVEALRANYGTTLNRQQADATRNLKFSLARGGLTGGSAAVDAGRELGREASEATIQAERQARGKEAELRNADEQSRLSMISLAQSGADIGNAATQTANALRANISGARSEGLAQGLGDVFANTISTYRKGQEAAQFRKGLGSVYGKPWSA